ALPGRVAGDQRLAAAVRRSTALAVTLLRNPQLMDALSALPDLAALLDGPSANLVIQAMAHTPALFEAMPAHYYLYRKYVETLARRRAVAASPPYAKTIATNPLYEQLQVEQPDVHSRLFNASGDIHDVSFASPAVTAALMHRSSTA